MGVLASLIEKRLTNSNSHKVESEKKITDTEHRRIETPTALLTIIKMSTVTWYAFEDPKTKREYYYEPTSGQTTWTLPTSGVASSSKNSSNKRSVASPPNISKLTPSSLFTASSTPIKFISGKNCQVEAGGSYNKRSNRNRLIAVIICAILINTVALGCLVRLLYSPNESSCLEPKNDPLDNEMIEPLVDHQASSEATIDVESSSDVGDVDFVELKQDACLPDHLIEEEEYVDKEALAKDDYVEKEASVVNDDYISSPGSEISSSESRNVMLKAVLNTNNIKKVVTPAIPVLVSFGVARIAVTVVSRLALILFPPAAPVVVQVGPLGVIKKFFGSLIRLGRPAPPLVVPNPSLLHKIGNMLANLMNIK